MTEQKEDTAAKAFQGRRDEAKHRLDALTGGKGGTAEDRTEWFRTVYQSAEGDPAAIPWADLKPKEALLQWLKANPGAGRTALDVACGLGDNAQALAEAGYVTTAFDLADEAIAWAKRRFPEGTVSYHTGDLFNLPAAWQGAFDLVHECYTLQALQDPLRQQAFAAIADLVAPGGRLLLITRTRPQGAAVDGPPWPLQPSEWRTFETLGFSLTQTSTYDLIKGERHIPHVRAVFEKPR